MQIVFYFLVETKNSKKTRVFSNVFLNLFDYFIFFNSSSGYILID